MAVITIRDLDEPTSARLRVRAARHGMSVEDEAREILTSALRSADQPTSLAESIRRRVEPLGGIDISDVPRDPMRSPPALPE